MLLHILAAKSGACPKPDPQNAGEISPIFFWGFGCPAVSRASRQCPERWQKTHGDVGMGLSFLGTIMIQFSSEMGLFWRQNSFLGPFMSLRWTVESCNSRPFLFWVGMKWWNQKLGCFIQVGWSHQARHRSELDGRQLDIVASQSVCYTPTEA